MTAPAFKEGDRVRIRSEWGDVDGIALDVLVPGNLPDLHQELDDEAMKGVVRLLGFQVPSVETVRRVLEECGVDYVLVIGSLEGPHLMVAMHTAEGEWRDLSGARIFVFHHYKAARHANS